MKTKTPPPTSSASADDSFMLKESVLDAREHLLTGFRMLAQFPCTDYDFNKRIASNLIALGRIDKAYNKSLASIQDKYVERDEEGKLKVDSTNNYVFKNKDARKKYIQEKIALENSPANEKMYFITHDELQRTIGKKFSERTQNGATITTEFTPAMIADLWSAIKPENDVQRN